MINQAQKRDNSIILGNPLGEENPTELLYIIDSIKNNVKDEDLP